MFQSVTVTNYRGDSLELPLRWPNDSGLLLYKIDGITPGEVTVNSQDYAVIDGGVYNSSRIGTRTISLYFYYGFTPQIETSRHRAYQYFPVKEQVRLDFLTDERALSIWGWVQENETQIFSEKEEGQITVICPDPYFYERDYASYILGSSIKKFEFPFSNESLTKPLIEFSEIGNKYAYEVQYNGDIEVGAIIRIQLNADVSTIGTIKIHDIRSRQVVTLDLEQIEQDTGVDLAIYGSLVINSVRGSKDIYFERYGVRKSLLGAFDVIHFPWMYLGPGLNQFAFEMDDEDYADVTISIEHSGAYGGV